MNEEKKREIYELGESINRIDEINDEIDELVKEAAKLIRTHMGRSSIEYRRAEAYWIPTIKQALNNDEYFGTIESTILEMEERLNEMKEEAKETSNNE